MSGNARVQTAIHVRYLIAKWGAAFGKVRLPIEGFSVSIGANLRSDAAIYLA